ncbi:molybdopterin guanine dinucleotide biosynthesis accessory protein MobB [Candidatus Methanoperedens nitroreducens]|uniref:Molybdopterin guanine dinucleotide biosynthesis accessory protein MobB n=2 Tax=Candidatus Methanoperedens nitratireducens TaxID=1392998 RepID=A0A062V8U0_9EURY|nr:molybdopterin guanine dinucleotide biosynthesis accessory protein MobB [Candidatus Methanoperedens nitroreducens]
MPPVICIMGKSKLDRSRLMEALIKELKARGLRVGALKHHKHGDFEIDIQGKDTWKYAKAGADTVAISSSVKLAVIKNVEGEMELGDLCDKYFADNDLVLADGFALSGKPRIIIADSDEDIDIFKRGCCVVAVVGRAGIELDDIDGIANRILQDFCLSN